MLLPHGDASQSSSWRFLAVLKISYIFCVSKSCISGYSRPLPFYANLMSMSEAILAWTVRWSFLTGYGVRDSNGTSRRGLRGYLGFVRLCYSFQISLLMPALLHDIGADASVWCHRYQPVATKGRGSARTKRCKPTIMCWSLSGTQVREIPCRIGPHRCVLAELPRATRFLRTLDKNG